MSDDTGSDALITFNVKASSGPKHTVTVPLSMTIADLKTKLSTEEYANLPANSQRLIYSGKVLKDPDTIGSCGVKEGNTMHLVRSAASNQRQNPANQSSSSTSSTNPPSAASQIPQNFAAGTGNDIMTQLTGARYAGYTGLPSLQELANPPSQEEILRRLNDPSFAQQMNAALQNPQVIDMMINSNPQLRALGPAARQMLQSEEFRRTMTDPNAMRSMMQMQQAMGGGSGMFGGGGREAFAMPGATSTTEEQQQPSTETNTAQQPQQNPLANMFGGGASAGFNPFMFMGPPPATTDRSTTGAANTATAGSNNNAAAENAPPANPFAALFPPRPSAQTGSTPSADANTQQPNPFANPMANPMVQGMAAQMMQNPEYMRNMMQTMQQNPQALQNAMQMMQQMGMGGGLGAGAGAGGFDPFAMFGGMGGEAPAQPADTRPPEERFATQLQQLNEMGFYDFDRNVQALNRSGGNVNGAIEWLFSQP